PLLLPQRSKTLHHNPNCGSWTSLRRFSAWTRPTSRISREFFQQLGEALSDESRVRRALFVLREDYLGPLEPYLDLIPTRLTARFRMDLLNEQAARKAIQGPAQHAAGEFTEEASDEFIRDRHKTSVQNVDGPQHEQEGPYDEPVELQVVCKRLWE